MARTQLKLSGSSILEVIISMVLILIIFGIAMTIYANVLRLSLSAQQLNAQFMLRQIADNTERNEPVKEYFLQSDSTSVEEKFVPYEGDNRLTEIQLKAYDRNHKLLAELRKIIITSDE